MFDPPARNQAVVEWEEVRETYLASLEPDFTHPQRALQKFSSDWRSGTDDSWIGCSAEQMKGWVKDGYQPPAFSEAGAHVVQAHRPETIWEEEGENIDIAAALSGDDTPFFFQEDQPTRPGLRVVVELAFLGSTSAEVLAKYGAWVAGALYSLETAGYDLAIDVSMPSRTRLIVERETEQANTIIRVKREQEPRAFSEWSALFAPGGFRTLGFTARSLMCQKLGVTANSGMGSSYPHMWGVEFDPTTRELKFTREAEPTSFPVDHMKAQLAKTGLF